MRRVGIIATVSAVVVAGLVVALAVVWPGLDAQETPKYDTSVWALQTGDGRRYARVNTSIGELDTVRSISNPSEVAQGPDGAYLYSDSFTKLTKIDPAQPVNLDEETLRASDSTPSGTKDVATSGDFAAYLTDAGAVFAGRLSTGSSSLVDPDAATDNAPQFAADAIAVDARGRLYAYSKRDKQVLVYDIVTGKQLRRDDASAIDPATPLISAAGDTWVLVGADTGDVLVQGRAAEKIPVTGTAVVGAPSTSVGAVYVASASALVSVPVDGSSPRVEEGSEGGASLGVPATPVVHDGEVFAAWVGTGADGGVLWSSKTGRKTLDYGGLSLPNDVRPAFVQSANAVILNETRSGWVWLVPDGTLVTSSQDWSLDDRTDPTQAQSDQQQQVVIDPKPPIAEPDTFGVRAGALVSLPVLLNDHDPNQDVLSIDPASVTGLDPGFGTLSITDNRQQFAVQVAPGASGTATFQYAVSDGTTSDGLLSKPTTVTLTVVPPSQDGAPVWCGVEKCLQPWPTPEVARGGTVTVPVLPGWVDPESDPVFLLSVQNPSGVGTVAASPSGEVVYQHADDGSGGEQQIDLIVTVSDTTGKTAERTLTIRVTPQPKLTVQSFASVDVVGAGTEIDVAPHVTGTAGSLHLTSVRVLDQAAASATIVDGSTRFDFSAQAAGTYRVDFTVSDGQSDATGTAKITLLPADAPAQLATAPVVAFVHPQQDATLDVLKAVSNPTGRVLLINDIVGTAASGASLSVDGVGQSYIRVSGTTATGASGLLGTVTYAVSDGTDDAGSRVTGTATVYLLPEAPELAPIAVDDTVTVREGTQIDIPVLDNDISPAGGVPVLDPSSVRSSTPDALAFASGSTLRYLAPATPGDYTVEYSDYTSGSPRLQSTATVHVHVLSNDTNRAPTPRTLEGRVLAGQSVLIPFDGYGMDPDGDTVTLTGIDGQPQSGVATISPDGASILYTSVSGYRGQVSFTYEVTDEFGAVGKGTVRVGVLDDQSNPSPVTFTDYVQVQASETNSVRVSPLANDIDPTMQGLTLTDVRPDLPATLDDGSPNPQYEAEKARVTSTTDGIVVITAGTDPGTTSFLYDVKSGSGNTGRGLIVVQVIRDPVPDYPIVADTVLTPENRDDIVGGVDVLTGRSSWSAGDVSSLTVSLWHPVAGFTADGRTISGAVPEATELIPFVVTGKIGDTQVSTYAFLRVPGRNDMSVSLQPSIRPVQVTELESAEFDMTDLVSAPRGTTIEVGSDVSASGARQGALCSVVSGTVLRYDANANAPWVDACRVPVRVVGQQQWTYLSVPITVIPRDPQPQLSPASITVGPGETQTYELKTMTTWQLRPDWENIRYAVQYSGSLFQVSLAGSVLTVTGNDRALPGAQDAVVVTVTNYTSVQPARLILRVGAAPSTLPAGGTVARQCSQANGSSCTFAVIGASGEVNPLPRTPLIVVAARPVGACVGVSFQVASPTSVTASWTSDAPGATCTAAFSVQDAQGRITTAERDGTILLDLQGYPKAPASVRQTDYADGTLTLRVDPGAAALAYPALTGFVVRWQGQVVAQCAPNGVCPDISAPNGEQRTYEVWAVNAVGESRSSVRTLGWAYDAPATPGQVTATPLVTADGSGKVVDLQVSGIDAAQTGSLRIQSAVGETRTVTIAPNQTSVSVSRFVVGSNTQTPVTVTPVSRYSLPPGLAGSTAGSAATVNTNGVGAPVNAALALQATSNGNGSSTILATGTAQPGGDGSQLRFGVVQGTGGCTASQPPTSGSGTYQVESTVPDGIVYTFTLCVRSMIGGTSFGDAGDTEQVRAVQSQAAPQGYTFTVAPAPQVSASTPNQVFWTIQSAPTSTEQPPTNNHAEFSGYPTNVVGSDPGIRVRYVHNDWGTTSNWADVTPAAGSAPYQLQARWSAVCTTGSDLQRTGASSNSRAALTFSDVHYYRNGLLGPVELTPDANDPWLVPAGADYATLSVAVDWSATGWNVNGYSTSFRVDCNPPSAGG